MDKDIELYGLVPDGKNAWCIINEDNVEIVKIYDTDIKDICETIDKYSDIEKYSAEEFIERAWEELRDNFSPHINNCELTSDNWDKFCAWCDYLIVKYLAQEIVGIYKQRLRDFE
jgi:hypothetical protein